jgi:hypothetical protein
MKTVKSAFPIIVGLILGVSIVFIYKYQDDINPDLLIGAAILFILWLCISALMNFYTFIKMRRHGIKTIGALNKIVRKLIYNRALCDVDFIDNNGITEIARLIIDERLIKDNKIEILYLPNTNKAIANNYMLVGTGIQRLFFALLLTFPFILTLLF